MKLGLIILPLLFFLAGCNKAGPPPDNQNTISNHSTPSNQSIPNVTPSSPPLYPQSVPGNIKLVEAYPNLSFSQPVDYRYAGDNTDRVFVVEKSGKILVFQNDPAVKSATTFLDITKRVDSSSTEKGLLSLTFHPNYKNNGYFYVNYTDLNSTVIARYQVDPSNPDQGLINSETVLLTFPQPYPNHKGGELMFGSDGYLYIASGDGGSEGDPQNNAQNRSNLLGKILRIDVDNPSNQLAYGIPDDNPYVGNQDGFREEIYAYGLRNPWKFSFDQERGWLWAADVGQDRMEEIDIIKKGANYGWNLMEGTLPYKLPPNYDQTQLTPPVWEYQHPIGNAIIGGYAYYGKLAPSLKGWYVYGDEVSGMIWALWLDGNLMADNRTLLHTNLNISSFGLDQNNELYAVDYKGKIYKFTE